MVLCVQLFCLMPDHFHMIWMGLFNESNQLLGMKHFRKSINESLRRIGYEFQDQSFDHVLEESERTEVAFRDVCDYIARNPERSELVPADGYASYRFSGCVVPGYPSLRPFDATYWGRSLTVSFLFLRKEGLFRGAK